MIRENRVMAFFKGQGYRLFCFTTSFGPGRSKTSTVPSALRNRLPNFCPLCLG